MIPTGRHTRIVLAIAGIGIAAIYILLLHYYALVPWVATFVDAIVSTVVSMLAIWLTIIVINNYPTRVGVTLYAIVVATFVGFIAVYASTRILFFLEADEAAYLNIARHTIIIRYIINWLLFTWLASYLSLRKRAAELEILFRQQADAAALLKDAELYKLRQQLQPHFLYNSLNSISALTMIEPAKAQEMIGKLSDFLRSSVRREAQDLVPVKDELLYIESYLSIESVRFGDRLKVQIDKEDVDDAQIPPFLLQPLLENAIKFGLYGKTGSVTISVHIALDDNMLTITITNPYEPDSQMPKGTGFGIEGIRRRLYLLYARVDLLETKQHENTFTTILKIPRQDV